MKLYWRYPMSKAQIDYWLKIVKNSILPDGTTVYDLMLRPDIGQEEARIAFEAALNNNPNTPRIAMHAVRVFAETHGYDPDKAFYEAVDRVCEAVLVDLGRKRKH